MDCLNPFMEAQHLVLVFAGVLIGTGLALGLIWWYTLKGSG
jgi:hypothetical protein